MDFNRYFNNDELEQTVGEWAEAYPSLLQISSLGTSYEGREILLLTVTNQATGLDTEKPALWIDANIHATEIAGTTTALAVVHQLLSGYGTDEQATRLLDSSAFYIVPRLNPDGAAQTLADTPHLIRSGTRPYPFDEEAPGLHRQDMDGDGRVLQMRIPDPNGDWQVSDLDPRLMKRRGPDDQGGQYYRLFPEGRVHEYDGYLIQMARSRQGLDFNRNFPFEWQPENEQSGAGPYPASEVEVRAAVEFISRHPNISVAITYHTFSGVILRPFSTRADEKMETNDLWVYEKMGQRGTAITDYPCLSVYHGFRYHPKEITTGAFDDWVYDRLGIFAFTVELWDLRRHAGIETQEFLEWHRDHPHEQDLQILQWLDEHGEAGGVVDWYEFDHPQLGRVELGGFNSLYTWSNPPAAWMGQEAARNVPFPLALGEMLPRLAFYDVQVQPLAEGSYRLRVAVENTGFLPTFTSDQGKKRSATRPVRIKLTLPEEAALKTGKAETELGHLAGRSHRLGVSTIWSASPTDNRTWQEWTLTAPAGSEIGIELLSDRAGTVRRMVEIG
jgi:murein tripeptide amidase MpaA